MGIRRFQNLDGSLTSAGKERYARMISDVLTKGRYESGNGIFRNVATEAQPLKRSNLWRNNSIKSGSGAAIWKGSTADYIKRINEASPIWRNTSIKSGSGAAIWKGSTADYIKRTNDIVNRNRRIAIAAIGGTAAVVAGAVIAKKIIDKHKREKQEKEKSKV